MVYLVVTGAVAVILNWVIDLVVTLGSVLAMLMARVEDIFCQEISNSDQDWYFLLKNIFHTSHWQKIYDPNATKSDYYSNYSVQNTTNYTSDT